MQEVQAHPQMFSCVKNLDKISENRDKICKNLSKIIKNVHKVP